MKLNELEQKSLIRIIDNVRNTWDCRGKDIDGRLIKFQNLKFDKTSTERVIRKFYKNFIINCHGDEIMAVTNKGNFISQREDIEGEYEWGILINDRPQCLGETKNSWAYAIGQMKTTSEYLAQLAVFANKHAK